MKKICIPVIASVIISLFCGCAFAMSVEEFYLLANKYDGINPFAATVQSAHETGDWTSFLWTNANNGAGMKAQQSWIDSGRPYISAASSERSGGTYKTKASYFRRYESPEQFFSDYVTKIQRDYPHSAKSKDNIWGYFAGLYRGRIGKWATDHRYYEKLTIKAIKLAPCIFNDGWKAKLIENYNAAVARGYLEEWQKGTIEKQLMAAGVNINSDMAGSYTEPAAEGSVNKILDDIYKRLEEESRQ